MVEHCDDNYCNSCPSDIRGLCCREKQIIRYSKYVWEIQYKKPCPFLNTKTNRCKVYDKRHEVNKHCLTIAEALKRPFTLPYGCKYLE